MMSWLPSTPSCPPRATWPPAYTGGRALGVAASALMVVAPNYEGIENARRTLDRVSIWLMAIRLIAMAVVWYFWDDLVDWFYKDGGNDAARYLKARRTNVVLLFVVIELLLVQNVIGELWQIVG